ncbi:hypothetical protein HC931_23110 [Candidatus Gracilibacteria bacterium]|nr:hypothetical protein [Candidatus Gracilibacteria bacterium]NJM89035.1 hypothetical protein [Hydrococcus sp. RU_2_2]NJP21017.1 hypothetical protein [Hydrococcus sp. CRU_1_1]
MTIQENKELTQYTIAKFMSEQEAQAALKILSEAGFQEERLSQEEAIIDPMHGIAESQVKEGAKGGAIAGAVFGGLIGCSLFILANYLPSSAINGDLNPLIGLVAGAIIGAAGMGAIGAISARNVPQKDAESMTSEYKVMLEGTREEVIRAKDILTQQGIEA